MGDNTKTIRGTMQLRQVEGNTKKFIVCIGCGEVAAEFTEDTQVGMLSVQASLDRHVMYRHNNHEYITYDRAKNTTEPGIVLRERRIN